MKKSTSGKGDILLRAIPAIPDIIAKGERVDMREVAPGLTGAFYAATVEIAGESHRLGVVVREAANGRYQYDLTMDTGNKSVGNLADGQRGETLTGVEVEPDTDLNLFLVGEDFNTEPMVDDEARWDRIETVQRNLRTRLGDL